MCVKNFENKVFGFEWDFFAQYKSNEPKAGAFQREGGILSSPELKNCKRNYKCPCFPITKFGNTISLDQVSVFFLVISHISDVFSFKKKIKFHQEILQQNSEKSFSIICCGILCVPYCEEILTSNPTPAVKEKIECFGFINPPPSRSHQGFKI